MTRRMHNKIGLQKRTSLPGIPGGPAIVALTALVTLAACERSAPPAPVAVPQPVAVAPASALHAAFIPTQADLARFNAEGPDPTLRKIAAVDYYLHYRLMQATGIEKELGGEDKAIAALKALGEEYERRMRIAEIETPKMVRTAAFTGEGMSAGFIGMGMGSFLGIVSGGISSALVGSMSDAELAELNQKGGLKFGDNSGSAHFQFDQDGSMTQSMEFEVNTNGISGKVKMKSRMSACPDADGKVTVDIDVDSQMSVSGKPGSGGFVHSSFKYERYLDDDAHLIESADGAASSNHIRMGGFENFQSQTFDVTTGNERGGKPIFVENAESGFSIFQMDEVRKAMKLVEATDFLQAIVAESMLRGSGTQSGSPWESGRCIDLKVSSSPAKRKGARPNTAFDLEAAPRAKSGGASVGGTVTATLNGGASLQPASGKVPADAKYGYTGPTKKDESATVDFEARSKRGVGRATLEFDTKQLAGYRIEGGADEFHGTGLACDLAAQFFVEGGGNTVRFEPASATGGRYSYSGKMSGFEVWGHGTYTVKYHDDVAVSITATGPGNVKTPIGTQTRVGTEKYSLTPASREECAEEG
jgi:hypothetical protein